MRWIVADTETTGPTPKDRVCEIAWVELNDELQVIDKQHSLIDPQMHIGAGASGVHGITDKDVIDAPTLDEFFDIVYGSRLTGDVVFIAHNVDFDIRYLGPYIPTLKAKLCTLRLARRVWPDAENHKLATLAYELDLQKDEAHSADGDVVMTLDLLRKIVAKTGKTLEQLAEESMEPIFVEIMPFGKHKGAKMRELPATYLNWLAKLDNLDRDMRFTVEKLLGRA